MLKKYILLFILAFVAGYALEYYLSIADRSQYQYIDKKVRTLSLPELSLKIVNSTALAAQSFSSLTLPEIKQKMLANDPSLGPVLDNDKFWINFKTNHADELHKIDQEFLSNIAQGFYHLPKDQLLEYIDLKEHPEVKRVQNEMTKYATQGFPKNYLTFSKELESLIETYCKEAQKSLPENMNKE